VCNTSVSFSINKCWFSILIKYGKYQFFYPFPKGASVVSMVTRGRPIKLRNHLLYKSRVKGRIPIKYEPPIPTENDGLNRTDNKSFIKSFSPKEKLITAQKWDWDQSISLKNIWNIRWSARVDLNHCPFHVKVTTLKQWRKSSPRS